MIVIYVQSAAATTKRILYFALDFSILYTAESTTAHIKYSALTEIS